MNVFVANIGERDISLKYDGTRWKSLKERGAYVQEVLRCQSRGLRFTAEAILMDLDQPQDRVDRYRSWQDPANLACPILVPALREALSWLTGHERTSYIDLALLIATDQTKPDPGIDNYDYLREQWEKDTIYSARLIARTLPLNQPALAARIGELRILDATGLNPSRSEPAYRWMTERFLQEISSDPETTLFVSLRGGTPQMNSALQGLALDRFGSRAVLIEVDEPPPHLQLEGGYGVACLVDSLPFRRNALLRVLAPLLAQHEYHAALGLLHSELTHSERERYREAILLLRHADARFNGDFAAASHQLDDRSVFPLGSVGHFWQSALAGPWLRQRLLEIAMAAELLWERNDYVGFSARVATLCEACRRLLVYRLLGLPVDGEYISESDLDENTRNWLRGKFNRGRPPIKEQWRVGTAMLAELAGWGERRHQRSRPELARASQAVRGQLDQFATIEALRHKALHENRGIASSQLTAAVPQGLAGFREWVGELLERMGSVETLTLGQATPLVGSIYPELEARVQEGLEGL